MLGFFEEPVEHSPTILGAHAAGDLLVVDLSCFHPGPGKSKAYSAAEAILSASLQRDFGPRLTIVNDLNKQLPLRRGGVVRLSPYPQQNVPLSSTVESERN
jgi:hypothetical protein